jgi:FixJ family two-component response regulator
MTSGATKTRPLVFIVDDDESVRRALRRLFKSVGLPVETFASAAEFLDCGHAEEGGCLVLDVRMPGVSGLELQSRLKAAASTLPIVFITAHDDPAAREQALNDGAVAFLQKPFEDEALVEVVERILADRGPANAR